MLPLITHVQLAAVATVPVPNVGMAALANVAVHALPVQYFHVPLNAARTTYFPVVKSNPTSDCRMLRVVMLIHCHKHKVGQRHRVLGRGGSAHSDLNVDGF